MRFHEWSWYYKQNGHQREEANQIHDSSSPSPFPFVPEMSKENAKGIWGNNSLALSLDVNTWS